MDLSVLVNFETRYHKSGYQYGLVKSCITKCDTSLDTIHKYIVDTNVLGDVKWCPKTDESKDGVLVDSMAFARVVAQNLHTCIDEDTMIQFELTDQLDVPEGCYSETFQLCIRVTMVPFKNIDALL